MRSRSYAIKHIASTVAKPIKYIVKNVHKKACVFNIKNCTLLYEIKYLIDLAI